MAAVKIREYSGFARDRYGDVAMGYLAQPLVTDQQNLPIQTITTTGVAQDVTLNSGTKVIEIETDADVRYAVRPKDDTDNSIVATADHPLAPTGVTIVVLGLSRTISLINA